MPYLLNVRPSPADHPLKRIARTVHGTTLPLPPEASWLSGWFPGIRDQGPVGSCTGHGGAGFREVLHGSATRHLVSSRLSTDYLWARTRQAEGSFPQDAGCTVADMMGTLHSYGVCREELLPYRADPAEAPTPACDADALLFRCGPPLQVALTQQAFKTVLAAGMPIVAGMPVGASFMSGGAAGKIQTPPAGETPEGGHCVFCVGYNAWGTMWANSWGTSWGDKGWFYLPWGYEGLMWEAWTASLVA